jgi:hypothetical protein
MHMHRITRACVVATLTIAAIGAGSGVAAADDWESVDQPDMALTIGVDSGTDPNPIFADPTDQPTGDAAVGATGSGDSAADGSDDNGVTAELLDPSDERYRRMGSSPKPAPATTRAPNIITATQIDLSSLFKGNAVPVKDDILIVSINVQADTALKEAAKNQIKAALDRDPKAKVSVVGTVATVDPGSAPDRVTVTVRVTHISVTASNPTKGAASEGYGIAVPGGPLIGVAYVVP